jgi:glycosyltransferase involved in cell wall biosynthesis
MTKSVFMPGFKQYSEIPAYYALAEAFILPSTTEQWGLVVNEAMASGLPVLVSERAGSAGDLVQSGFNGYTFDPYNVVHLSDLMVRLAIDRDAREAMGTASSDLIKEWSPDVFSKRLLELAAVVTEKPKRKPSFLFEIFLRAMLFRFSRMV